MAQAGLTYRHWHTLLIHHCLVSVPETTESTPRNPELLEQRLQLPFANYVAVFGREEKTELIRSPLADVLPQMLDQLGVTLRRVGSL